VLLQCSEFKLIFEEKLQEISGSHGDGYEDGCLLTHHPDDGSSKHHQNTGQYLYSATSQETVIFKLQEDKQVSG
jgi:hypothetical protein